MKKYFLSIVALAGMLFATSCQESLVEPQMEGPTTFTVQVPDAMGTKAIGDASSVNKLFVEVYSNANSIFKKSQEITNGSTTVSLDLIKGQEYQIVFWAQKDNSYITDFTTQGLAEISIPYTFHNNESGAAFYAYETFVIDGNAKTVTLKRPFAQLNLGTTEASLKTDASASNVQLISSSVTLATATKFSTIFGAGINVDTRTYTASISSFGDEKLTLANGDEYVYVSMDYLPVVYGGDVVELGVKIETNLGTITHNFTNVPIQKNYRTNIVGNLISSKTDFEVEISEAWDGEENYNAEWGKLLYAAENGGEVTLSADVKMPHTLIVADDKEMVLNLNGHDIIVDNDSDELGVGDAIVVYGKLTIKGEGTVQGNTRAVWARGNYGAEVRIEGGNYIGSVIPACEVIYASGDGKIEIYGGTFEAKEIDNTSFAAPQYAVLNLYGNGAAGNDIKVYGGSFKNFNPADNISENPKHNFCAPGYVVSLVDGWYEVAKGTIVSTTSNLLDAIANPENNLVVVDNHINLTKNAGLSIENNVIVDFEHNDLIAGGENTKTQSISVWGEYDVEVRNTNITGGSIMAYYGAEVVLDGVNLTYNFAQSGRNLIYVASDNDKQAIVTIKGGNFEMTGGDGNTYLCAQGNAIIYVKGGNFRGKTIGSSKPAFNAPAINSYVPQIIITGGTFDHDPSAYVPAGYKAEKSGSIWTVSAL